MKPSPPLGSRRSAPPEHPLGVRALRARASRPRGRLRGAHRLDAAVPSPVRCPVGAPPPPAPCARARGFTLIELMAVLAILGVLLLAMPARMDTFGDRSRLDASAATLVSAFTAARETAIIDGHETRLQFLLPTAQKDRTDTGAFRYLVSSRDRRKSAALMTDTEKEEDARRRENEKPDEAWIETEWRRMADGIRIAGFSTEAGQWLRTNPRGDPVEVSFLPDGSIRPACAVRLTCVDMASGSANTLTVVVNALTSLAVVAEGEQDLPKSRDPSDFR